jgi:hypothetical protein
VAPVAPVAPVSPAPVSPVAPVGPKSPVFPGGPEIGGQQLSFKQYDGFVYILTEIIKNIKTMNFL